MENAIQEILTRLVNEWAPAALELGVKITFWNGVNNIFQGVIGLLITFFCYKFIRHNQHVMDEPDITPLQALVIAACVFFIGGIVLFLCSGIFNIWTYVALFDPKTAFAHDIYMKLVK